MENVLHKAKQLGFFLIFSAGHASLLAGDKIKSFAHTHLNLLAALYFTHQFPWMECFFLSKNQKADGPSHLGASQQGHNFFLSFSC